MREAILSDTLSSIRYKPGWAVHLTNIASTPPTYGLFWSFVAMDATTEKFWEDDAVIEHVSRVWLLEPPFTVEGIVRTAFAAALQAEEHECREFFRFREQRPFDPHRPLISQEEKSR